MFLSLASTLQFYVLRGCPLPSPGTAGEVFAGVCSCPFVVGEEGLGSSLALKSLPESLE